VDENAMAWSIERSKHARDLAENIWKVLGPWKDYNWVSPHKDYVNIRAATGEVDAEPLKASRLWMDI
jgi:hypothetical protein